MAAAAKYYQAQIIERRDFSPELWAIRTRCEGKLSFTAGQYATLGVERHGKILERPYSIVSSPYEETLEFFFELVPDGGLTPHLYELPVGAMLLLRKTAKGRFTFDALTTCNKHLLIATVTGVAPYCSLLRTLYRDWREGRLHAGLQLCLIQGASRSWELGYRQECEGYAQSVPGFTYVPTISRPWDDSAWQGEVGRCEDILRKYGDPLGFGPADTTAYLCGHPGMIEQAKAILGRRGFAEQSLHEEHYWLPKQPRAGSK